MLGHLLSLHTKIFPFSFRSLVLTRVTEAEATSPAGPLTSCPRSPLPCSLFPLVHVVAFLLCVFVFYRIPLPHRCLHYFRLINFQLHPNRRRSGARRKDFAARVSHARGSSSSSPSPALMLLLVLRLCLLSGFPFSNRSLIAYFGPKRCGYYAESRTY